MNKLTLLIAYQSADGSKALPVAKVESRDVLLSAARSAIAEKRSEAEGLAGIDGTLGMLAGEDARRLERTLGALIPELRNRESMPALAM